MIQHDQWRATAAYFYVLQLDPVALAWEYLRRNRLYRCDWERVGGRDDSQVAHHWGLRWP